MQHKHAGQLLDVFQPEEIQSILAALMKLNDSPNLGGQFKAYTNGFQPTDLIYPFIKRKVINKLETLLDEFHLQLVRKNNGDTLSGGERRRTEIARALAVDPKFILLDEPFAGVDPIAVEDIQAIVAKLKFRNIGILITDHNVNETLSICDRAYLLIDGKIFTHGTAEELANNEQVRRLYLGKNFELKRKDYLHDEAAR